jgi:hypothetical protein
MMGVLPGEGQAMRDEGARTAAGGYIRAMYSTNRWPASESAAAMDSPHPAPVRPQITGSRAALRRLVRMRAGAHPDASPPPVEIAAMRTKLVAGAIAVLLAAPVALAVEEHHPPEAQQPPADQPPSAAEDPRLERMQERLQELERTEDPATERRLMREQLADIHAVMREMHGTMAAQPGSPGAMGGPGMGPGMMMGGGKQGMGPGMMGGGPGMGRGMMGGGMMGCPMMGGGGDGGAAMMGPMMNMMERHHQMERRMDEMQRRLEQLQQPAQSGVR